MSMHREDSMWNVSAMLALTTAIKPCPCDGVWETLCATRDSFRLLFNVQPRFRFMATCPSCGEPAEIHHHSSQVPLTSGENLRPEHHAGGNLVGKSVQAAGRSQHWMLVENPRSEMPEARKVGIVEFSKC